MNNDPSAYGKYAKAMALFRRFSQIPGVYYPRPLQDEDVISTYMNSKKLCSQEPDSKLYITHAELAELCGIAEGSARTIAVTYDDEFLVYVRPGDTMPTRYYSREKLKPYTDKHSSAVAVDRLPDGVWYDSMESAKRLGFKSKTSIMKLVKSGTLTPTVVRKDNNRIAFMFSEEVLNAYMTHRSVAAETTKV